MTSLTNGGEPFPLKSFTVSGLPSAATYKNHAVMVSDEATGNVPAYSDGTNWRRFSDNAMVTI